MEFSGPGNGEYASHDGRDADDGQGGDGLPENQHRQNWNQHGTDAPGNGIDQGKVGQRVTPAQQDKIENVQDYGSQHEPPAGDADGV